MAQYFSRELRIDYIKKIISHRCLILNWLLRKIYYPDKMRARKKKEKRMEKDRDLVDGPRSILVILKLRMFPSEALRGSLR